MFLTDAVRLRKHKDEVARVYPEYDRWHATSQASTFLGGLQPAIAMFGLVACLVIVLVFTTATWWTTQANFRKVAIAYGAVSLFSTLPKHGSLTEINSLSSLQSLSLC